MCVCVCMYVCMYVWISCSAGIQTLVARSRASHCDELPQLNTFIRKPQFTVFKFSLWSEWGILSPRIRRCVTGFWASSVSRQHSSLILKYRNVEQASRLCDWSGILVCVCCTIIFTCGHKRSTTRTCNTIQVTSAAPSCLIQRLGHTHLGLLWQRRGTANRHMQSNFWRRMWLSQVASLQFYAASI